MQPGATLTDPSAFVPWLLAAILVVVVLTWYIVFVQRRHR
jgi:hypothetical protein